jgi:hypothetical protein
LKKTIAKFTAKNNSYNQNDEFDSNTVKNTKLTKDENALQTNSYESDLSNVSEASSTYDESSFLRASTPNSLKSTGSPLPEDVENFLDAGMAPFKSVLTVLLRHAATSELSELFQNAIRPALQRLSDLTNSPASSAVDSRNISNDVGLDPRGDPRNNSSDILSMQQAVPLSMNDSSSGKSFNRKSSNRLKGGRDIYAYL